MKVTKENLRTFLGWCTVINLGFLLYWILALSFARDWVFLVHTSAVEISKESFAEINYAMMGYYKLAVILFNVTPYLVLRFAKFSR
ncbi:MAG TPA: hypothetical protein DCG39_01165 [Opitutae bacterium]|nr:hypothetical protein [Opitutae bacterium]|tara:strand:+ start:785 stop:1042 length:258 start_codon:yes stop_codon:yes gene_type:complete